MEPGGRPSITYPSMVYRPGAITAADLGRWRRFDAGDGGAAPWGLTGAAGGATARTRGSHCTLDDLRAALDFGSLGVRISTP